MTVPEKPSDSRPPRTVRIPLYAIVATGVAALASLLAIAFFVGRESAIRDPAPVAVAARPPETRLGDVDAAEPDEWREGVPLEGRSEEGAWPVGAFPPEIDTGPSPLGAPPDEPGRAQRRDAGPALASNAAVARYFRALDAVELEAKYWSNPRDLAMTLLGQVTSGDTSGFDDLVTSQRRARDRVGRISPPPPCADHHRRVLSLMGRGVSLLETVRDAATAGDAGGLMALPTQAQELESEARQVDAMGKQIRQRFGVPG